VDGEPVMETDNLGDSEAVLGKKSHLRQTARSLIKRGIIPEEGGWRAGSAAIKLHFGKQLWTNLIETAARATELEIEGDLVHQFADLGTLSRWVQITWPYA
jgi:hypothetical protein